MKQLEGLPKPIQAMAEQLFKVFEKDPSDPILHAHPLNDSKAGRHRNGSIAVEVTYRYRAIYVVDRGPHGTGEPQYCWYWIGTHESYSAFIGSR